MLKIKPFSIKKVTRRKFQIRDQIVWKEFGKFEEVVISDSRNINQPVKKPKKKKENGKKKT